VIDRADCADLTHRWAADLEAAEATVRGFLDPVTAKRMAGLE
jgi:hypothetical protein